MFRSAWMLAVQLAPCIFLLLLGWGLNDVGDWFANPARAGFTAMIFAAAVTTIAMRLDLNPSRKGVTAVGWQKLELVVLLLLSLALLWFLPFADRRKILLLRSEWWRWLGLAMCAIGTVVRLLALRALGPWFSAYVTLQPGHRLVREGIYRRLRHPLYLSLAIGTSGMALVLKSVLALPILLLAIVFIQDRIRKEERLLAKRFGVAFEEYCRASWRLVPGC